MDQWLIYKHTSHISGKSYIGLTKMSMERRWVQHKSAANCGSTLHFHNAIRLYGHSTWISTILESNITSLSLAIEKEKYYIVKYDTFENGYNLTIGGEGTLGKVWAEYELALIDSSKPKYKFAHFEYGTEELTLRAMTKKYNMSKGNLHALINGTRSSHLGWQMHTTSEILDLSKNSTVYEFSHSELGDICCTISELSAKYVLNYTRVSNLVTGKQRILKGWVLTCNIGKNPLEGRKAIIREFLHADGTIYIGYSSELCRLYNLSTGTLASVIKGDRRHHKGWVYIKDIVWLC